MRFLYFSRSIYLALFFVCFAGAFSFLAASDADEMKVKRKEVFEFTEKPQVTRMGDKVTITFTSKDYCDVTIAIEDSNKKIIRHLVSGVLGDNAPEGLQKGSLKQTVIWDSKDDQGKYRDDLDNLTVRVSLGLKPEFEKNLYWSPYKRISQAAPLMQACEEGVVVTEGSGVDSVKLFDHMGNYVRTIYPFPASKLEGIKSLDWRDFPQGMRLPWKQSIYQQTLLTSGDNCYIYNQQGRHGRAATGIGVLDKQIVLGFFKLNRINTDGSSNNLTGGKTSFTLSRAKVEVGPTSLAISPDKKWVYLAGYSHRNVRYNFDTLHGVQRIPLDGSGDAEPFVGEVSANPDTFSTGEGIEPSKFRNASSVDCDAQGRVYVSDFMNDRIQIFSSDAKFLKEIKTPKPALVRVNRKTGEIHVFSWLVPSRILLIESGKNKITFKATYARFGSFDNPKELSRMELPMDGFGGNYSMYIALSSPLWFTGDVDFWAPTPTIWLGRDCRNDIEEGIHPGNGGRTTPWESAGVKVYQEKEGKLELIKDFGAQTMKEVARAKPPTNAVQHIYVNPTNGKIYVGEADSAPTTKASDFWLEIDPDTGAEKMISLPFNPIDCAFDLDGYAYLRNTDKIIRFDTNTWREIPFDYGEEFKAVGRDGGIGGKSTPAISAITLPAKSPVCYHQGGINISPKGYIIASCAYRFEGLSGAGGKNENIQYDPKLVAAQGKGYEPMLFPGRISTSTSPCIHVWDKHGKILFEDAVPGIAQVDGVGMDANDNIYFMHTRNRVIDGKPYFNQMSETLTRVKPKKAKFVSDDAKAPVPLPKAEYPNFPKQLKDMWAIGADWFYPGVGFAGFSAAEAGDACACWFPRFSLDYFARSIVPEPQQFAVGVVDAAGNLILRIGKYGNVDSAGPKSKEALEGDGVGLFHPLYTGTYTDRRVFISDYGNGRIVSVKLNYHVNEQIALKDVANQK